MPGGSGAPDATAGDVGGAVRSSVASVSRPRPNACSRGHRRTTGEPEPRREARTHGRRRTGRTPPLSRALSTAEFFRALGHPVRIRLLQLLRSGERTVGALQAALDLDSSNTSQQLGALRKQGLVESRREGTNVYYRVKDRRTLRLLELAKQIIAANLEEGQALLDGLAAEEFGPPRRRGPGSG